MLKRKILLLSLALLLPLLLISLLLAQKFSPRGIHKIRSERLLIRGIKNLNLFRFPAAIEDFNKAISLDAENRMARTYLSKAYLLAGYRYYAMEEWRRYLAEYPSDTFAQLKFELLMDPSLSFASLQYARLNRFPNRATDFRYGFDMIIDDRGQIWVLGLESSNLVSYDINGEKILSINSAAKSLEMPYAIAFADNSFFVSDFRGNMVHKYARNGQSIASFGQEKDYQLNGPTGLLVADRLSLFIADSGNHRIVKTDHDGNLIFTFGKPGSGKGELNYPVGITMQREKGEKYLFVLEKGNRRIQRFDEFGNSIKVYNSSMISEPIHMKLRDSKLYITDEKKPPYYYDLKRSAFYPLEEIIRFARQEEKLDSSINAISWDKNGHILALDRVRNQVSVYAPDKYRISNLHVEILQVDSRRFPVLGVRVKAYSGKHQALHGLNQKNFIIYDEGVRMQRINTHSIRDKYDQLRLLLLVDNSKDMAPFLKDMQWVLRPMLHSLFKSEKIKVMHFADTILRRGNFDWSARRLQRDAANIQLSSGKNFAKAIYQSLNELSLLLNKKAILVVTAGETDQNSFLQYNQKTLVDHARLHDIPIYVMSFQGEKLRDLAEKSGGKHIKIYDTKQMAELLPSLRNRSRNYYQLSFVTFTNRKLKGRIRELTLKVQYQKQNGMDKSAYVNP